MAGDTDLRTNLKDDNWKLGSDWDDREAYRLMWEGLVLRKGPEVRPLLKGC